MIDTIRIAFYGKSSLCEQLKNTSFKLISILSDKRDGFNSLGLIIRKSILKCLSDVIERNICLII